MPMLKKHPSSPPYSLCAWRSLPKPPHPPLPNRLRHTPPKRKLFMTMATTMTHSSITKKHWEKGAFIVEVYYAGSRENAPY